MNNRDLTDFQVEMRNKVSELFSRKDICVSFEKNGDHEKYLHARIDAENMEIWLYEDEVELRLNGGLLLYERPAYKTQALLAEDFLGQMNRILGSTGWRGEV